MCGYAGLRAAELANEGTLLLFQGLLAGHVMGAKEGLVDVHVRWIQQQCLASPLAGWAHCLRQRLVAPARGSRRQDGLGSGQ